jgi:cytoskeleton protein RodZ
LTEAASLGIGRALAEARQAQGLELADVAQQLKFMTRQIEALENERFDSLPGPTIARGMVRTYARFLKLDPEPLIEKMAGRVESRDATPQLAARFNQPVPFSDSGRRSTVAYLALSAVVLAIAGGVFYQWQHERKAAAFVSADSLPAPERAEPAPAKAAPVPPVAMIEPPHAVKPAAPAPVVKLPEKPAAPSPAAKPAELAAEPKPPSAPLPVVAAKDLGASSGGLHRLVLQFDEDAWVEVVDANGRNLVSSLNRAGTERSVRVSPPFNLVVGNASHVKVIYNDKPIDLQPHIKVEVARFTVK